jgi:PrtD family type I secretion system ABC transporter
MINSWAGYSKTAFGKSVIASSSGHQTGIAAAAGGHDNARSSRSNPQRKRTMRNLLRSSTDPSVSAALGDFRRTFWSVAAFSAVVNILMFASPLYMMQVYDRVLSGRSIPTLVGLTIILVGVLSFQALVELIRSRIVVRAAGLLDRRLADPVHRAMMQLAVSRRAPGEAQQPVRDLDQIRSFLTGTGPVAIVDLPLVPVFLVMCGLVHYQLGIVASIGAIALTAVTFLTERASRVHSRKLTAETGIRSAMLEGNRQNNESAAAMGMGAALAGRWTALNDRYAATMRKSSDVIGGFGSFSKALRLLLQSAMLGLGAYLVIRQEMTAGAMIAASTIMSRGLAPIELAIANWRGFVGARDSIRRLSETLSRLVVKDNVTELPRPSRSLEVALSVAAPDGRSLLVKSAEFKLVAGEVLGIIGPSGSGKTSLARALVGVWPAVRGTIRLDGATLDQWGSEALGRHIGYVSQTSELFDGTIAENIARMSATDDSAAILAAAQLAGAHDMIVRLPAGYDTRIGEGGAVLSAGQRQRIALARALYGNPFLVVLDEPNSNLDGNGEGALQRAIQQLKANGVIVIIIAHRPASLSVCDKVLVLTDGVQQAFGPRDEVLSKLTNRNPQPAAMAGNLRVVSNTNIGDAP